VLRLYILVFLSCTFFVHYASAQNKKDSLSVMHSPTKATIMSAIVPGAGQAYNKKYWKIPIIYAGFAGLGYLAATNNSDYKIYKEAYRLRLDGDESTVDSYVGIYSDEDLVTLKDYYRRNRDLSYICMGILYVLNVIDASVDAHLFYFNVNDDLSMNVQPGYSGGLLAGPSLNLSINF
jgi:hypothetical protein